MKKKTNANEITIRCTCCNGTGRVRINGVHADTLALLCTLNGSASGAFLAKMAGCKPSAMCNRLAWLERHGFATSQRYGRERRFEAVEAPTKAEVPCGK